MLKIILFLLSTSILMASSSSYSRVNSCSKPDDTFEKFFDVFLYDQKFQKSRVVIPLVYRYGDYSIRDIKIELWDEKKIDSISYPLINNNEQRKSEGLEQRVLLKTDRYVEVYHDKLESDMERILYKFRNIDGCWYLEEVHDKSL